MTPQQIAYEDGLLNGLRQRVANELGGIAQEQRLQVLTPILYEALMAHFRGESGKARRAWISYFDLLLEIEQRR